MNIVKIVLFYGLIVVPAIQQILDNDYFVTQRTIKTTKIEEAAAKIGQAIEFRQKLLNDYDPDYKYIPTYENALDFDPDADYVYSLNHTDVWLRGIIDNRLATVEKKYELMMESKLLAHVTVGKGGDNYKVITAGISRFKMKTSKITLFIDGMIEGAEDISIVIAASGHYVGHLFHAPTNTWYVANDSAPITTLTSQVDERIDVERSSLFLFCRDENATADELMT